MERTGCEDGTHNSSTHARSLRDGRMKLAGQRPRLHSTAAESPCLDKAEQGELTSQGSDMHMPVMLCTQKQTFKKQKEINNEVLFIYLHHDSCFSEGCNFKLTWRISSDTSEFLSNTWDTYVPKFLYLVPAVVGDNLNILSCNTLFLCSPFGLNKYSGCILL